MSATADIHADLDPLGIVRLADGSYRQEIELVLSNDPDRAASLADPVCSRCRQLVRGSSRSAAASALRASRATVRRARGRATMTVKPPAPPPLPGELDRLLRRLRLPYVRKAAPEVIANATAQRWEHAEVLRVLLSEEASGRDQATTQMRRRSLGAAGRQDVRRVGAGRLGDPPADPARVADLGVDRPGRGGMYLRGRRGPGRAISSRRSVTSRSTAGRRSRGTRSRRSPPCCAATAPTIRSAKRSAS